MLLLPLPLLLCLHLYSPTLIHICQLLFTCSCSLALLLLFTHSCSLFAHSHPLLSFLFTHPPSFTALFALPPAYSPAHHHLFVPAFICSCPSLCLCLCPFICACTCSFMPACGSQCRHCPCSSVLTLPSFMCAHACHCCLYYLEHIVSI